MPATGLPVRHGWIAKGRTSGPFCYTAAAAKPGRAESGDANDSPPISALHDQEQYP
jgi:hypothetical protein